VFWLQVDGLCKEVANSKKAAAKQRVTIVCGCQCSAILLSLVTIAASRYSPRLKLQRFDCSRSYQRGLYLVISTASHRCLEGFQRSKLLFSSGYQCSKSLLISAANLCFPRVYQCSKSLFSSGASVQQVTVFLGCISAANLCFSRVYQCDQGVLSIRYMGSLIFQFSILLLLAFVSPDFFCHVC
jgi:hypothetical protein